MAQIRKAGNCCPPSVLDSIRRTKRTAEGCKWGHSLDNFFCAKGNDEDYSWTDVWTTSVLQELGVDGGSNDRPEPTMRARKPWPVLKVPRDADAFPSLGNVDPGSDHEDETEQALGELRKLRVANSYELSAPDVTVDPFQIGAFPKLEESIPPHYLPKLLCIHDPDGRVSGTEPTGNTIYYRRMFPEHHPDDSENGSPDSPRIAHLYLTRESRVGCGHHSNVYRASFHLPPPLDTESQGHVAVVAKVAVPRCEAREFLHHEAATYNTFPDHLAQEYCGYALVPGLKYPVPVGAVVPKFFGYYVPEQTGYDASNTAEPSPILLLEECGSPVDPQNLSHDNKAECFSMFLRLHMSGYLQKSAFKKNILVQPGPLTVPLPKRSLETPSFRIIDFGRAVRRPPKNHKDWLDEKETEVKDIQKVLRIPRHSMC